MENKLHIYCDQFDFSAVERAFEGEFSSDAPLAAEIVFVDEEEIRRLNRENRAIDCVTDVLSFPALDGICGVKILKENFPYDTDENGAVFMGSIAICTRRAEKQAEEYGHGYNRELHYLVVHGLCHLFGYDHEAERDRRVMREKEERILERMGIAEK